MKQESSSTHTYSLQGKSGVSLICIGKVLTDLRIPAEAEIRKYLPTSDPTASNTISRFRTTIHPTWQEAHLEGRVSIHDQRHDDSGAFSVSIHVGGEDEDGASLSKERYTLTCTFADDGMSENVDITHPKKLGTVDGVCAIRQAWNEAELSLSSKAWSDSWNRLHRAVRSLQTTSMNYLTFNEEQSDLVDEYVKIAQACGIRCYRHDQPAFVASEQLSALIQAELEEKTKRIEGKGSATARSAQVRLEAIGELATTLTSLKGLLGDLATDLETRVGELRATWEGVLAKSKRAPQREKVQMTALTEAGRDWVHEARKLNAPYTLRATRSALDALPQIRTLIKSQSLNDEDLATFTLLERLCRRFVSVDPTDTDTMTLVQSAISQGYVGSEVLTPEETREIIKALEPLLGAPLPSAQVSASIASIPAPYHTLLLHTYTQG